MGFGVTSSAPCLAAVFGVCSFLFVTIWVAPENRARELRTRGSTVLTQDSQESQMGRMLTPSTEDQISCISRLSFMLLGNSTPIDLSRDTAARRCRAGRKQAVYQGVCPSSPVRGEIRNSLPIGPGATRKNPASLAACNSQR